MSGDSPNAHTNNVFDYLEGRSSPTPTTSKEANTLVAASVLVEPSKADEKERNSISLPGSKAHDATDQSKLLKLEGKTEIDGNKEPPKDVNGSNEKLNAKLVPPPNSVKGDNDDDENCIVKCLYYTMQCCECTII